VVCVRKTLSELMTKAIGACSDFMRDLGLQVVLATGRSHVLAQGYRGHKAFDRHASRLLAVVCTENLIRVDDVMESPKLAG